MNDIKSYLDTVCEQIRFQKAHTIVKRELQDHITDQTDAFIQQGFEKEIAVQKAIEQMGDPVLVGTELDRVHRPATKWEYIVFVILFSFINFILRFIVMQNVNYFHYDYFINWNTIFSLILGIAIMIVVCHIDFTILANNSQKIYMIYIMSMVILHIYLSIWGTMVNGTLCYITIGFITMKSPDLIYIYPVILTALLYDCRGKRYCAILLCGSSFLPVAFLSLYKGSNAAILVVAIISVILIVTSILKNWFAVKKRYAILLFLIPTIALTICIASLCPYFHYRLQYIYNAIQDPFVTSARQILQNNVKSASLFGMGELLTTENGKLVQLPMLLTKEYITAYMLYYCGWIIFTLFLAVYLFFIARGFLLAHRQKSQLGFMTAFSIVLTFCLLTVWNIGINSGYLIDFNPLEIPFFCYGSHANILFFILMGLLLSVFKNGKYIQDSPISTQKNNHLIQFKNGTIIIHFNKHNKGEDLLE